MIPKKRLGIGAGVCLLVSAITHVLQLFIYGVTGHIVGAAAFGVLYFFIGLGLVFNKKWALWPGAVLPAVGGILGILRFVFRQSTPFIIFHVLIDLVVVPICIYLLMEYRNQKRTQKQF
jgi:hypothetical protein